MVLKDCFIILAIVSCMDFCSAIINKFIFVVIMLSSADITVAKNSLSSCWRLLLKSSSICLLFSEIVLLSLSDVFASLSCS